MDYLITGAGGMLGTDLRAALAGRSVAAPTRAELDITDPDAVDAAVAGTRYVINAAAYTKVDDAETHESEAELINAVGPRVLAEAAAPPRRAARAGVHRLRVRRHGNGALRGGRAPASRERLRPHQGGGEEAVLAAHPEGSYIVRTAWLYGAHGPNFAKTMRRFAAERDELSVVDDQVGQPTWTVDLADRIVALLDAEAPVGIYHGTSGGRASWFDFARASSCARDSTPSASGPPTAPRSCGPRRDPGSRFSGTTRGRRPVSPPIRDWESALDAAAAAGATTPRGDEGSSTPGNMGFSRLPPEEIGGLTCHP